MYQSTLLFSHVSSFLRVKEVESPTLNLLFVDTSLLEGHNVHSIAAISIRQEETD
jgi:hypothetical protein